MSHEALTLTYFKGLEVHVARNQFEITSGSGSTFWYFPWTKE
jgi:hypothetical protein